MAVALQATLNSHGKNMSTLGDKLKWLIANPLVKLLASRVAAAFLGSLLGVLTAAGLLDPALASRLEAVLFGL